MKTVRKMSHKQEKEVKKEIKKRTRRVLQVVKAPTALGRIEPKLQLQWNKRLRGYIDIIVPIERDEFVQASFNMAKQIYKNSMDVAAMHDLLVNNADAFVAGEEGLTEADCQVQMDFKKPREAFAQNGAVIFCRHSHLADISISIFISKVNAANTSCAFVKQLIKKGFKTLDEALEFGMGRDDEEGRDVYKLSTSVDGALKAMHAYRSKTNTSEDAEAVSSVLKVGILEEPIFTLGTWDGNPDKFADYESHKFGSFAELEKYCEEKNVQGAVKVEAARVPFAMKVAMWCHSSMPLETLYEIFMTIESMKGAHGEPIIDSDKKFTILSMVTKPELEAFKLTTALSRQDIEVSMIKTATGELLPVFEGRVKDVVYNKIDAPELWETEVRVNRKGEVTNVILYDLGQYLREPLFRRLYAFAQQLAAYTPVDEEGCVTSWGLPEDVYYKIVDTFCEVEEKVGDKYFANTLKDIKLTWQQVINTFVLPADKEQRLSGEDKQRAEKALKRDKQQVFEALSFTLRAYLEKVEAIFLHNTGKALTFEQRAMLVLGMTFLSWSENYDKHWFPAWTSVTWENLSNCAGYLLPVEYFLWCVDIAEKYDGVEPVTKDKVHLGTQELEEANEYYPEEVASFFEGKKLFFEEGRCWQQDEEGNTFLALTGSENLNGWFDITVQDGCFFAKGDIRKQVSVQKTADLKRQFVARIEVELPKDAKNPKGFALWQQRQLQKFDNVIIKQSGTICGVNDFAQVPEEIPGLKNKICMFGKVAKAVTNTSGDGGIVGKISFIKTIETQSNDENCKQQIIVVLDNVSNWPATTR